MWIFWESFRENWIRTLNLMELFFDHIFKNRSWYFGSTEHHLGHPWFYTRMFDDSASRWCVPWEAAVNGSNSQVTIIQIGDPRWVSTPWLPGSDLGCRRCLDCESANGKYLPLCLPNEITLINKNHLFNMSLLFCIVDRIIRILREQVCTLQGIIFPPPPLFCCS